MQNIFSLMNNFFDRYLRWIDLPEINHIDFIEIIILSFLIYNIMVWIQNTRTWMVLKGIVVILLFILVAAIFQMNTILWIAGKIVNVAIIAVVIVFQPELRRALDQLGRKNFIMALFPFESQKNQDKISERTVNEMVKATFEMAKVKTGALIVMEQDVVLTEFERTGIALDSLVSSQLLVNIFEHNTPLHDGAIIVRGDRIVSATCYLPLSDSLDLSKDLGTRHRAALGVSEVSDALVIVVSEETGNVSITIGGDLYRNIDAEFLKEKLTFIQKGAQADTKRKGWKRRLLNVKKNVETHNK